MVIDSYEIHFLKYSIRLQKLPPLEHTEAWEENWVLSRPSRSYPAGVEQDAYDGLEQLILQLARHGIDPRQDPTVMRAIKKAASILDYHSNLYYAAGIRPSKQEVEKTMEEAALADTRVNPDWASGGFYSSVKDPEDSRPWTGVSSPKSRGEDK